PLSARRCLRRPRNVRSRWRGEGGNAAANLPTHRPERGTRNILYQKQDLRLVAGTLRHRESNGPRLCRLRGQAASPSPCLLSAGSCCEFLDQDGSICAAEPERI